MTIKIDISSLEFEAIKTNIKEYFKKDTRYSDYNYEGSGWSGFLNILSYNTHYNGYYIKMVLNEAFSDTAQTLESQISHAKRSGYIAKGKTASYSSVSVKVNGVDPAIKFITIPAGTTFNSTSTSDIKNAFHSINDYTIRKNSNGEYVINDVIIKQGNIIKNVFRVMNPTQKFRIQDLNCDINTVRVFIKTSENTTVREQYNRIDDIIDVHPDSKVWYTAMSSGGYYDIYFGQDRFGRQPVIGEFIEIEYISTNGTEGNNVTNFTISPLHSNNDMNIGFYNNIITTTIEISHGGVDAETVEDLRFAISNHNRRQKRVVNENDYRSILVSEFRDVDSIAVWGGEKSTERRYAKMFVSIKPKNSDNLSVTAETLIKRDLERRFGIVGSNVDFVRPEFINLDIIINIKKNKLSTVSDDQIESENMLRAEAYNKTVLNKFDTIYSDTEFVTYLRDEADYIISVYTQKIISKKVYFDRGKNTRYHIIMGNPINDMKSSTFKYGVYNAYFKNEEGFIYVYNADTDKKLSDIQIGFILFETGNIYIDIPRDLYDENITVTCNPSNPDIETYLNNIVRFNEIDVKVT